MVIEHVIDHPQREELPGMGMSRDLQICTIGDDIFILIGRMIDNKYIGILRCFFQLIDIFSCDLTRIFPPQQIQIICDLYEFILQDDQTVVCDRIGQFISSFLLCSSLISPPSRMKSG